MTELASMSPGVSVYPPERLLEGAVVAAGGRKCVIEGADGVIVSEMSTDSLGVVVEIAQRMRWIQLRSAGIEGLTGSPLAATLVARGVTVTNAAAIYGPNVAEHALGLILGMGRNLFRAARSSCWEPLSAGKTLYGRRVCVIGAGGIAAALLRLLQPFNCEITVVRRRSTPMPGAARTLGFDSLHEALQSADIVVLACPLTPQTYKLVDQEAFEQMHQRPLIVNVGRGALIDTEALRTTLTRGGVSGAALDVTDPEPLSADDPLWHLDNVVITPHMANDRALGEDAYIALVRDNVRRFINEEELINIVAPNNLREGVVPGKT